MVYVVNAPHRRKQIEWKWAHTYIKYAEKEMQYDKLGELMPSNYDWKSDSLCLPLDFTPNDSHTTHRRRCHHSFRWISCNSGGGIRKAYTSFLFVIQLAYDSQANDSASYNTHIGTLYNVHIFRWIHGVARQNVSNVCVRSCRLYWIQCTEIIITWENTFFLLILDRKLFKRLWITNDCVELSQNINI